jgi:NUDIX domain
MSMSETSRVGFVIIKMRAEGASYYLMRINPKWKDINFIGGHEKPRDVKNLKTTARRELWEEVPSIRARVDFHLEPLTPEVIHGPILSKSRGVNVEYQIQFFC